MLGRLQGLRWVGGFVMLLSAFACTSAPDDPERTDPSSGSNGGGGAGRGEAGAAGNRAVDGGVAGRATGAAGSGGALAGRASAGQGAVGGVAAGGGGASDGQDAGADDVDAAVSCEGEIVADRGGCLQDDAFCYPLGDGRYCTGPSAPTCPSNSTPIDKTAPCPERTECFDVSESLRCATRTFTLEECAADGGLALSDPGDGSLVCPGAATALGSIVGAGWDEGGLCCPAAKQCGARAGDTCEVDEFCAYQEGQLCGAADAQANCQKRPTSCSGPSSPVCGCDQRTYPSACEANVAGVGIYADQACE